jgi:hypothetical protein
MTPYVLRFIFPVPISYQFCTFTIERIPGKIGWQVGKLAGWQVGKLAGWQVGKLTGWQVGKLTGWQVGKLESSNLQTL